MIRRTCRECGCDETYLPKTPGFNQDEYVPLLSNSSSTASEVRVVACKNCGAVQNHFLVYERLPIITNKGDIIKLLRRKGTTCMDMEKIKKALRVRHDEAGRTFFERKVIGRTHDEALENISKFTGIVFVEK